MFCFLQFWASSSQQIHKTHKITSNFYGMTKILTKKFWSQGTSLGSLGPGSREALGLGACWLQIPVIWGPYEPPVPVVFHEQAKSLKPIPSRSVTWTVNHGRWAKSNKNIGLGCCAQSFRNQNKRSGRARTVKIRWFSIQIIHSNTWKIMLIHFLADLLTLEIGTCMQV